MVRQEFKLIKVYKNKGPRHRYVAPKVPGFRAGSA